MDLDTGDVAGVIAGFKAGKLTEQAAKATLRELGVEDGLVSSLLSLGAGIVVGGMLGSAVDDFFDGLF